MSSTAKHGGTERGTNRDSERAPERGTLRVGTRGSALALAQTGMVAAAIRKASGLEVELVTITTSGDTSRQPLSSLGGTGVFTGALRRALLAGECDLVVHSLKDLPTGEHPGIALGAVPKRADARDALVARDGLTLAGLPDGARVGTGSPRRVAQLRERRPDLEVVDIRGNVDSRLAFVARGELDAVILAAAGLDRLGRADAVTELLDLAEWPTAAGQGALAVEVRTADAKGHAPLAWALRVIDHTTTHAAIVAERAVLAGLEAGCAAPVAVSAQIDDGLLFVTATVYRPDGGARLTSSHAATPDGMSLGQLTEAAQDAASRVVAELLSAGAAELAPLGTGL